MRRLKLLPVALRLTTPWRYAVAPAAVLLAFIVQHLVFPYPSIAPFVFFFAAVAVASWLGGRGPGLLAVLLSAAVANHAFVDPPNAWSLSVPALAATALFVVAAALVAFLCSSFRNSIFRIERAAQALREQEQRALDRAAELQTVLSERSRVEESLAQSEARFRRLAEALPQMVFDVDAEGRGGYFNEQWRRYTGTVPAGIEDRSALVHPDDRARMADRWTESLRCGSPYECEYRFRRHDGEYRWILARALPVHDASGRVLRWFGTATDVHELKQTQEELQAAARRKDEFLAMLSHELRNPLAPITTSLYILQHAAAGGEQARRAHEVIARQTEHLSKLVDELLDATRLSRSRIRLQKERLDLGTAVSRAVEDHRALFERSDVSLAFTPAASPLFVNADPTRLAQMIGNLLQNAAKFTFPGGHTSVVVALEGGAAVVRVTDDGEGIAPEMLGQLFQPFAQARQSLDRSKGGLGLGLALVKGLVELHGGTVSVRSDGAGKGTECVLCLPVAAETEIPLEIGCLPRGTRTRRILIVEDNADAAGSLREALELWRHVVAVAPDAEKGLECARAFRPEFILCDIGLPGMDGYAFARALRADPALSAIRLVALSGYALPEDVERAGAAGFDGHLAKPPSFEALAALLA